MVFVFDYYLLLLKGVPGVFCLGRRKWGPAGHGVFVFRFLVGGGGAGMVSGQPGTSVAWIGFEALVPKSRLQNTQSRKLRACLLGRYYFHFFISLFVFCV